MTETKEHTYKLRVYYEDTDAQGVVYYANYLKFIERARTEFLRSIGYQQEKLLNEGLIFVVNGIQMSFRKPAKLDDGLKIKTSLNLKWQNEAQRVIRKLTKKINEKNNISSFSIVFCFWKSFS